MPKRALQSIGQSQITERVLQKMATDLERGVPLLPKLSVADDMVPGLRFIIYKSGEISIHVSYVVAGPVDRRPFIKIGTLGTSSTGKRELKTDESFTLAEARELAKNIKAIGDRGIDVERDARKRLLDEIRRDGSRWSPTLNSPARKG